MRRKQLGVSLLLVGVMLILIIGSIIAFLALFGTGHGVASTASTTARLVASQAALEQFASQAGRLPCPTNPTLDTGDEDRSAGTCNFPQGTLPWHTIGLRHDDGLDAWGWKISYRVYSVPVGGLTQDNGASMVQCDTVVNPTWDPNVDANGLCRTLNGWHTKDTDFLVGKGLTLTDFGSTHTDVAYVLISHGPSGLGGYTSAGVQQAMPNNADEVANTSTTGPFIARAAAMVNPLTTVNYANNDPAHFDDIIAYRELADFVSKSNLGARDWPDPPGGAGALASVVANNATVAAAVGQTSVSNGDLGRSQAIFNNASASVTANGTSEDLTFNNTLNTTDGIGGGGSGSTLSSAQSEVLHIALNLDAQSFAITVNGLGCRQAAGSCVDSDSVLFTFFENGSQVATATKFACNPGSGLASFSIDPMVTFNSVDIAPQPSVPLAVPTAIYVSEFDTCVSTCTTTLDTPANHCP